MRYLLALILFVSSAWAQTPNMGISKPTPGITSGPLWAQQLNDAIDTIDAHDHSSGKGKKVTPAGIDVTGDIEFNGNDAKELRTTAFDSQGGTLSAADTGALYNVGGNLYWNNGSGAAVQITSGSAVNNSVTGAFATTTPGAYPYSVTAGDAQKVILVDTSSARTINLPAATTAVLFAIKDKTGSAASNNISVVRSGGDTIDGAAANATLNTAYGWWFFISDGVSNWTIAQSIGADTTATARSRLGLGTLATNSTVSTGLVDNDAITYAKIQNVSATDRLLGRSTAGAGDIEEITCTSFARNLLDDASASAARTTLSAAALGANSDITSLSGITRTTYTTTVSPLAPMTFSSSASEAAYYVQIGKMVFFHTQFTFTPNTNATNVVYGTLPLTAVDTGNGSIIAQVFNETDGLVVPGVFTRMNSTSQYNLINHYANYTLNKLHRVQVFGFYLLP